MAAEHPEATWLIAEQHPGHWAIVKVGFAPGDEPAGSSHRGAAETRLRWRSTPVKKVNRGATGWELMATETTSEEDVYEALEEVIDPELGLDFVSLGLVYDVEIEGPEAFITFTLTTPACPIGPQVSEQMREFVGQIEGIEKVHPKMVFDPPWSPEMMSEDAKFALGY